MKSSHAFCYSFMTCIAGLFATAAGIAALIFAALGEQRNCLVSLGLMVLLALLSLCYSELSKPKSWSTGRTRGIYTLR